MGGEIQAALEHLLGFFAAEQAGPVEYSEDHRTAYLFLHAASPAGPRTNAERLEYVDRSPRGEANPLRLRTHDPGVGFDPRESTGKRGLGLTSPSERGPPARSNLKPFGADERYRIHGSRCECPWKGTSLAIDSGESEFADTCDDPCKGMTLEKTAGAPG